MIQVRVRVQWLWQDVGGVFASAYATDFAIAVGIVLSDCMVSNVHRSVCFGESRVCCKDFRSLIVAVSKVGLSWISVEFQN